MPSLDVVTQDGKTWRTDSETILAYHYTDNRGLVELQLIQLGYCTVELSSMDTFADFSKRYLRHLHEG
jgi:hypothetical protein